MVIPGTEKIVIPGVDSRSLSLFRMALGFALLVDMVFYKLPYFHIFFSENAVIQRETLQQLNPSFKCSLLYFMNGDMLVWSVVILSLVAYACIMVGYRTRWAVVLAFICLFSLQERNIFFPIGGSDDILRLILFWSIFLPLDTHYTLFAKGNSGNTFPKEIKVLAIYALLLQVGSIYFFNALAKHGATWKDGTAVSYALMVSFIRGAWANGLLAHPLLCKMLTYGVKYLSFTLLFLILSPFYSRQTRVAAAIFIFCFHWGLIPFLNVQHFCFSTLPFLFLLMPGELWDKTGLKPRVDKKNNDPKPKPKLKLKQGVSPIAWREKAINAAVGFFMFLMVIINIAHMGKGMQPWTNKLCDCWGLNQRWDMFAPDPLREHGMLYTVGILDNNNMIDLCNGKAFSEPKAMDDVLHGHDLLPLSLAYFNIIAPNIKLENEMGQGFWKRWMDYWSGAWKKEHPKIHLQSVFVTYISTRSEAPGVYSVPQSRFIVGTKPGG